MRMRLFDVTGREVMRIVDEVQEAGVYTATVNSGTIASGIYFYMIEAGRDMKSKKLVILR